ncbi:hypothetical protein FEM48_Zijuj11G0120800 [Ziziphus jujuba var. spinosa]|uniref:peroxidase n=1 Tax=Ziziphus jujuba var. spinosa TaxID=714518 RepID=A0A978UIU2_ZIZJJ|nr:hypothetical protein FEM48_Zijuj11G0120800 [Ziziphus jujuba var. spinosa]
MASLNSSPWIPANIRICLALLFMLLIEISTAHELSPTFYATSCPRALSTIKSAVRSAVAKEARMGAFLLRLHFHDCFVNARIISCADIIAVAARDSVVALGGPTWIVQLGRRDSTTASILAANDSLPSPALSLSGLISAFSTKDFTAKEMVALSGSQTIGKARCSSFRDRLYNETIIDSKFAKKLKRKCPSSGSGTALSPLDKKSPKAFDNSYYKNLLRQKGLLHSEQQLFSDGSTDFQVIAYSNNAGSFRTDFAEAMVKMGNLSPLTGTSGQIRTNSLLFMLLVEISTAHELSPAFYATSCPRALSTIKSAVRSAVAREARMGASLLRLHFHDCFVNAITKIKVDYTLVPYVGCDASILLDDTSSFTGEKKAGPNNNSVRGFEVIDNIKKQLESLCPGIVSCADIVAVAARDSVVALGGPTWNVQLGRRDSTTASKEAATSNLPPPTLDLNGLISAFSNKGFTAKEMVALSGSHTIGQARCSSFQGRLNNEKTIDSKFAKSLKSKCSSGGSGTALSPLDVRTPTAFDNSYYKNLLSQKGLLHSDQQLFSKGSTDSQVIAYSNNVGSFRTDFANAMVKMGNLSPLTGTSGQIRTNCRKVN